MTRSPDAQPNQWNTETYDGSHSFVFEYGEAVVSLLDPQAGERVLDVGCGTGHLTDAIADSGADVVGVDNAEAMLAEARSAYPDHEFVHGDARDLAFDESFDAVFSNAALHWIPDQDSVLESVASVLHPGGRFVAELGGTGNVSAIVDAVFAELERRGYERSHPWYFPSVGEYASLLETHGFEVRYAVLFDRPTELDDGEDGLAAWLEMFGDSLLAPVPASELDDVVAAVEDELRAEYFADGAWTADYRRLRFVAVKTGN
ncbi:class I SAM-dependent methyltransferase [Halobacterium wangiae]|uniref:class I SAM-dependent methyltransferase n=1 Tax=Halobacterium wangiae TaxID=2902623 RepID=UPI001E626BCC|nr:class I SAM-dependent methyltransferase [Halobacterium wangiae]